MSMKTIKRLPPRGSGIRAGLVAALLLGGCMRSDLLFPDLAPIDPLAAPGYGMAQICIVRPHTWAMARTMFFHDNGNVVGATRGPSYFCYAAHPGLHRLEVMDGAAPPALEFPVVAGQRLFFHHRVGIGHDRLTLMTEEEAPELLDKCEYSQLLDTPQRLVTSEAPARPLARPERLPEPL